MLSIYIKLEITKKFEKMEPVLCICDKFPGLSKTKIWSWKLISDTEFDGVMTNLEWRALISFKEVIFLTLR